MRLWHGDADGVVPVAVGRYLAQEIPHCRAEFIPDGERYLVIDRIGAFPDAMIG